jgi:hypothetical protein
MAERSELIRNDIERTRAEMGDTMDALGYKANVPARTKGWMSRKTDRVTSLGGRGFSRISGAADSVVTRVSGATPSPGSVQAGAGRVKGTAERNPLGLAIAGAAAGFVAGILAPSTTVENEKLGPLADQTKAAALDAGQEAFEHGKQVVRATVQTAADTAHQETQRHSEQFADSIQDKAGDVGY